MNFSLLLIVLWSFFNFTLSFREANCEDSNLIKCKKDVATESAKGDNDDVIGFRTSTENNQYNIGFLSFKETLGNEGPDKKDRKKRTKKNKKGINRRRHQNRKKSSNKREGEKLSKSKETETSLNSNLNPNQITEASIIREFEVNSNKINTKNELNQNKFSEFYSDNEIRSFLFGENNFLKKSFNLKQTPNINREYISVNYGTQPSNEVNPALNQTDIREFKHTFRKDGKLKVRPPVDVKNAVVRTHNILRGKVYPPAQNMLAMSWSTSAAEQAQKWADQCSPGSETDHPSQRWTRTFGTCGQNVYVAFKKKRWSSVLRNWWNEGRNFHYDYSENNITLVGKYTQMAWYNSHKVGCASAQCANSNGKKFYRYVCNYCPTGNDPSKIHRPYSEGDQCGSCPNSCISVCRTKQCKLCTNSCPLSDLWNNCPSIYEHWKNWLCNTKTADGVMRFKNCRATCQCQNKIT